jgi:arabinose-5-phosphate isomerase
MLKTLFSEQRRNLEYFFEKIDPDLVQKILDKLLDCKGSVVFSGVGKSGHIAEKISATFLSTGTHSFFLPPLNALHGDIGRLSPEDVCLLFSKSGESVELLNLVPHIKRKGAFPIAVVSVPGSSLSKLCELSVFLPVKKELCPYNLAPTTSTTAQLIFGDCLAIALMLAKQFTLDAFASNHPSGTLGRKITLKVEEVMLKGENLPLCSPQDLLMHVLHELSQKRCGCLLVIADGKLAGIFTDGDLRRAIETQGAMALQMPISHLMTPSPKSIEPECLAIEAVKKMEEDPRRPVTVLPVLKDQRVVGLIRMHDILTKEIS